MRIILGVVTAMLVALPATAQKIQTFSFTIDNAQEQAAGNCLIGSTAQGSGTAQLDLSTNVLSWSITFGNNAPAYDNGLLDQGAESGAHFHQAPPGVNGGVAVPLALGSPKVGSQAISAAQAAAAVAGNFYVNIHSSGCSSGEIRGQLIPGLVVPTLSQWGVIALGGSLLAMMGFVIVRRRARPV